MIRGAVYGLRLRTESLEAFLVEARTRRRGDRVTLSACVFHAGMLRARAERALADAREEFGPRLRRVK